MRARVSCLIVVLAAGFLSACGVRMQDNPDLIDRRDVPYGLLEPKTRLDGDDDGRAAFVVYFTRRERLVAVPRVAAAPATPQVVVEALLRGTTVDEAAAGLRSAISPGTAVLSVSREEGVVSVDLSAPLATTEELEIALRQLDATVLELPGVDRLRVLVSGREITPVVVASSPPDA